MTYSQQKRIANRMHDSTFFFIDFAICSDSRHSSPCFCFKFPIRFSTKPTETINVIKKQKKNHPIKLEKRKNKRIRKKGKYQNQSKFVYTIYLA